MRRYFTLDGLRALAYLLAAIMLLVALLAFWVGAQAAETTLAWDVVPGSALTRIFQRRAPDCGNAALYTPIADVPVPTSQYTLRELEDGGTYCWLVRAVDAAGLQGQPSYVIGYTVPAPALKAPTQLRLPGQEGGR